MPDQAKTTTKPPERFMVSGHDGRGGMPAVGDICDLRHPLTGRVKITREWATVTKPLDGVTLTNYEAVRTSEVRDPAKQPNTYEVSAFRRIKDDD